VLVEPFLIVVTVASIPGMRRLEAMLALLAQTRPLAAEVCVAVVGPRLGKWPRGIRAATGPLTRALLEDDSVLDITVDPGLALTGLSSDSLPVTLRCTADLIADRYTADLPTPHYTVTEGPT